eukprot:c13852_g1_i1.p1 GENE.c13852_g1_i1~~c13852_g1_i1.p1  ORF type:complete len:304 (+),score=93.01 c13852_g1_i1:24-914(+)
MSENNKTETKFPNPFQQEAPQNPFLDKNEPTSSSSTAITPSAAVKPEKSRVSETRVTNQEQTSIDERSLAQREIALRQKEAELRAKEESLRKTELKISKMQLSNYPFFYPILYNNPSEDIPQNYRWLTRIAFLYFHSFCLALLLNFVCSLINFSIMCLFISLLYLLVGAWIGWNFQYRKLYRALMNGGDSGVLGFLFHFVFGVGFNITMAIGIPQTCGTGLWTALDAYGQKQNTTGTIFFASFLLWTINGFWSLYIFKVMLSVWRQMGGSVEKAKKDIEKEGKKQAFQTVVSSYDH